uniref:Uncharacterized protein n=1 Tax=Amphimedon queenslandica TaxID=400682 RepID=A0A1X7SXU8_AMPQE
LKLASLEALGASSEAYNSLLPSLLMRKLPSELCLNISRRISEDTWNLDNLMNVLSDELKAKEWATQKLRSGSDTSHSHGYNNHKIKLQLLLQLYFVVIVASHICQKHVGRLAIQKQEGTFFKKADATFA